MSRIGQMSGERTDARKADRRSERQTDGEDQHTLARSVEDVVGED
jgi:hypothetical protein